MIRWTWAAACVTMTLYLVSKGAEWYWIAINVMLDMSAIREAVRGDR